MQAICLPWRIRSSFWAFCSSRLTFFLKWEFCLILFNAEAINSRVPAVQNSGNSCQQLIASILIHPLNRPSPIFWIHNIASKGKSEQELTWFSNLIFQYMSDDGVGNLSNWSSDICSLCCTAIEILRLGPEKGLEELYWVLLQYFHFVAAWHETQNVWCTWQQSALSPRQNSPRGHTFTSLSCAIVERLHRSVLDVSVHHQQAHASCDFVRLHDDKLQNVPNQCTAGYRRWRPAVNPWKPWWNSTCSSTEQIETRDDTQQLLS